MRVLKTAVIGVGSMGQNHARVLSDLTSSNLVGIVDASVEQAAIIGKRFNVPAFSSVDALLAAQQIDVAIVACPTLYHAPVARQLLKAGVHVLVEKPIAFSIEEAQEMIDCAKKSGVLLGTGHIERFNPAIIELKRRLELGELGRIFMIHAKRQSPLPTRIVDVGVGMDLATHELDMIRYLTGSEIVSIRSEVALVTNAKAREDVIFALLRMKNDVIGVLDVNWITPTYVREISVTGERGMFQVNYQTQELFFFENKVGNHMGEISNWESERRFSVEAGDMIRYKVVKREPLRAELEAFLQAVQQGGTVAPCTGEDGLAALAASLEIVASGHATRV